MLASNDRIVSRVAGMGREEALLFFKTDEGKEILADVARQASVGTSTARIIRPEELEKYLDVVELRIAQVTGGEGLWLNPETGQWVDNYDNIVYRASDRQRFPNEKAIFDEMIDLADGDESVIVGLSHKTRADQEAALNALRGYNLDELEKAGRVGHVTKNGNGDLRRLIAEKELDEIKMLLF